MVGYGTASAVWAVARREAAARGLRTVILPAIGRCLGIRIAGELWPRGQRFAIKSVLLGGLLIALCPMASADVTYDYTGQPFDPRATNCLQGLDCVAGSVTGTVTFSVSEGYTGTLYAGTGMKGFSFEASGTGASTSYPCFGTCSPLSVLDHVTFDDGVITSASLYTHAAGTIEDPFGGPIIDIGTGYGGDVSNSGFPDMPGEVWGYSDKPGTWQEVSSTPVASCSLNRKRLSPDC